MFENSGEKIRGVAIVVMVLGALGSLIGAIVLWIANNRYNPTIALGFGVLVGGVLGSWLCALFTYGFGQLIEDTQRIREELAALRREVHKSAPDAASAVSAAPFRPQSAAAPSVGATWKCKNCGETNARTKQHCWSCGKYR